MTARNTRSAVARNRLVPVMLVLRLLYRKRLALIRVIFDVVMRAVKHGLVERPAAALAAPRLAE
jgi:hypothetical protein